MLKNTILAVALAVAAATSGFVCAQTAAPAGDAVAGAKKNQMCTGCHGIVGWRTAYPEVYKVPKIGGQHAPYIVKALHGVAVGSGHGRPCGLLLGWRRDDGPQMMTPMKALAVVLLAMFAAGIAEAADVPAGAAKAKEVCQACHGMDGNSPSPDYPKIGGQYPDYMSKALRDYQSGARKNAIMAGFAGALSKQDIENLAAYYSSQPPVVATKH